MTAADSGEGDDVKNSDNLSIEKIQEALRKEKYIADRALATVV